MFKWFEKFYLKVMVLKSERTDSVKNANGSLLNSTHFFKIKEALISADKKILASKTH